MRRRPPVIKILFATWTYWFWIAASLCQAAPGPATAVPEPSALQNNTNIIFFLRYPVKCTTKIQYVICFIYMKKIGQRRYA